MKKIPQEEIRYIIEEYKKGKPIIQLAKELKRGQTTIRRLLENHNIPIISKRNQTGEIHKSKELFLSPNPQSFPWKESWNSSFRLP